jgi:hypothetical protein
LYDEKLTVVLSLVLSVPFFLAVVWALLYFILYICKLSKESEIPISIRTLHTGIRNKRGIYIYSIWFIFLRCMLGLIISLSTTIKSQDQSSAYLIMMCLEVIFMTLFTKLFKPVLRQIVNIISSCSVLMLAGFIMGEEMSSSSEIAGMIFCCLFLMI